MFVNTLTPTALYVVATFAGAGATSVKMDYLPTGFARVDPIHSKFLSQGCLSDHMHTFSTDHSQASSHVG